MKRKLISGITILFFLYISGYIFIRQTQQEIWDRDGKTYIIFPEDKMLYYLYRPLSVIDEKITKINIHTGQHK